MTASINHSLPCNHSTALGGVRRLIVAAGTILFAGMAAAPSQAASLVHKVDVNASPAAVWAIVGPYCAIQDWLPPIGSCRQDAKAPSIRTLVTKDKTATFVERETERSDTGHFYSYVFVSSPLPVRDYRSTIQVTPRGPEGSTVTWKGEYQPEAGQEKQASQALTEVYQAGLASIALRFAH